MTSKSLIFGFFGRTGPRVSGVFAALILSLVGSVSAQDNLCVGIIERTPIDGVGEPVLLAAGNHRLVSSDGKTMSTWSLCDPDVPEFHGRWTTWEEWTIWDVDIGSFPLMEIDDRGFVYETIGKVKPSCKIWDARGTGAPQPISVIPGIWVDFFVDGDLLVGITREDGLVLVDVSDPFNPNVICWDCGELDLGNGSPAWNSDNLRIEKVGSYAAILDYNELILFNYSDPSSLSFATYSLSLWYGPDCQLFANDEVAVLASDHVSRIEVVEMSDPSNPTISTHYFAIDALWGGFHDETLVFEDGYGARARRLDLSNPSSPNELSPIEFDRLVRTGSLWNDRLYVGVDYQIRVYDLENIPTQTGEGPVDQFANRIAVSGPAGLATGYKTLLTYDLDEGESPAEKARLQLDWVPQLPAMDGPLGAVFSFGVGVVLVDLSSLENPQFIFTVPTEGSTVMELEFSGDLLAVASRNDDTTGWIELWRVSTTDPPIFLSRIDAEEPIWQVEIVDDRVFLGLDVAIQEIDISNPILPVAGTSIELEHFEWGVSGMAAIGTELWVADYYAVGILDITTPGAAIQRETVTGELYFDWLTAGNDVVVGGNQNHGIAVLKSPAAGDPIPYIDVVPPLGWGHRGGVFGNTFYQARGHNLTALDLGCSPLEPDFTWYSMGTLMCFIDRTTFADRSHEPDRSWSWTTDNGLEVNYGRAAYINFGEYGTYEVTMEITTETGVFTVTKTVEVTELPGAALLFSDGFEDGGTCRWNSTEH